ncbi:energy transducer TonB [Pontixanthobacter aestiaquae]|uniref:Energy transducer TonB n=1 Tax=Pontixanthobacter aestiaquae TaxID=1509367 RepID=A0A844Z5B7_9SPHN|nr:energy transducer TonB [Pontixanthobacter aestiaquae]MDN3647039.1 energy transducer TonB [Pontixanthobacter aestiaquae]MXO81983.1 energy transducer TonB [Pontixanthobacter aestiaquae]
MSSNRIIALIIVALIHIGVGYVLVTGLAYEAIQKAVERVTTVDVEEPEEPEPEEEPPPPPEEVPETVPPPFVPEPLVPLNQDAPKQETPKEIPPDTGVSRQANKTCPDGSVVAETATCGPATKRCPDGTVVPVNAGCPEPKERFTPKDPAPRNNRGSWVTNDDYRNSWINRDYSGTVSFRLTVGTNGRASSCSVTGGTAPQALKDATCRLVERRARFNPATNGDGKEVAGSYTSTVRWQIPE